MSDLGYAEIALEAPGHYARAVNAVRETDPLVNMWRALASTALAEQLAQFNGGASYQNAVAMYNAQYASPTIAGSYCVPRPLGSIFGYDSGLNF